MRTRSESELTINSNFRNVGGNSFCRNTIDGNSPYLAWDGIIIETAMDIKVFTQQ